jgi:hypothetical protein
MKELYGFRLVNRCGWRTDYTLWGCYLARGHDGPHRVPSDPRIPADLTRAEQEDWERQMHPLWVDVTNKPKL